MEVDSDALTKIDMLRYPIVFQEHRDNKIKFG